MCGHKFLSPNVHQAFWMFLLSAQLLSPVQLCNPMDCSPRGSSVRGISQARILEWVAISSFRGPFPTWGSNPHLSFFFRTHIFCISCICIILIIRMWTWVPLLFFLRCDLQKWEGVFNLLWFDCFSFEWLVLYFVILLSKSFFFFYPGGIRIVSNTFFEVF